MAAIRESECRKLFTDFLLNAEVSNSYTLEKFKMLFPRKYRDHNDVTTLYEAYQRKRQKLRDTVLMNIKLHCRQRNQEDTEVNDSKYKDGIADLEAREQILLEEIDAMQEDIDHVKENVANCADTLEKRRVFSDLQRADFDTKKHKEFSTKALRQISER